MKWLLVGYCLAVLAIASPVINIVEEKRKWSDQAVVTLPSDINSKVGLAAVISAPGVEKLLDQILPVLIKKVQNLPIPGFSGEKDSIKYDISNIKVVSLGYSAVSIDLSDSISISATGVTVHVTLNWSYKEKIWPHVPYGSGTADANADGSSFALAIIPSVTSDGHLQVQLQSASVHLNSFKITIHGSVLSWLYDIILKALAGTLKSAIEKAIQGELGTLVDNTVNQMLASFPFRVAIDSRTQVDFTLPLIPSFARNSLKCGFTAAFEEKPSNTPPSVAHGADLMSQGSTGRAIDLYIDQYLVNSGFFVYQEEGRLQGTLVDKDIPASFPIRLNTSTWEDIAPGLYSQYPDNAMQLFFRFKQAPAVVLQPSGGSAFIGTGEAAFSVVLSNQTVIPVFNLTLNTVVGKFDASFTADNRLTGFIGIVTFNLTQSWSTVGPIDVADINSLINMVLNNILLPQVNKRLEEGVQIPTIDGLTLTNPAILLDTGFLRVSADIVYKPPSYLSIMQQQF